MAATGKQVRMLVHTRLKSGELVRAGSIVLESALPPHLLRQRYISYDLRPVLPEEEEPPSRPFEPNKASRLGAFGAGNERSIGEQPSGKRPSVLEQEEEFYAEQPKDGVSSGPAGPEGEQVDSEPTGSDFAAAFDALSSATTVVEEGDLGEGVFSSQRSITNQFGVYPIPCKRARTREFSR
jgi:hypothetical protein